MQCQIRLNFSFFSVISAKVLLRILSMEMYVIRFEEWPAPNTYVNVNENWIRWAAMIILKLKTHSVWCFSMWSVSLYATEKKKEHKTLNRTAYLFASRQFQHIQKLYVLFTVVRFINMSATLKTNQWRRQRQRQ